MSAEPLEIDDLQGLAEAGWALAEQHCGPCRTYHRLWGLLRAAGVAGGLKSDAPVLTPLLAGLLQDGSRVLLAGAADPGQLELVLAAAHGRPVEVTVLDFCATPLELFRRLRVPANLSLSVRQGDLLQLDEVSAYDLILSHGMLPFVPAEARAGLLRRLQRALRPGGRLVAALRTEPPLEPEQMPAMRDGWLARARARLASFPLPGPPEEVDALLRAYAADRLLRRAWTDDPEQIERELREAGLVVEQRLLGGQGSTVELAGGAHVRQGHVFVCR